MAPPSFADLGKSARDLFSKGFHFGFFKVEAKTKTNGGVEFTTGGSSSHDTGLFSGSLESKYKWKEHGATLKETWSTDNALAGELTVEDQLLEGLKLGFETKLFIASGKKSGKVKTAYKNDLVHTTLDFDVMTYGLLGSIVFGHNGFLGGFQLNYDANKLVDKSLMSQSNVAIGYSKDDLDLFVGVKGCNEYSSSVFHKIHDDLETGIHLSWLSGTNETAFGFGAKYNIDRDATIKAKVDNSSRVGLSYQQKLRPGVTLTLSTLVEGKTFTAGGHKFGCALEFEA
ncbi:hypothetical protein HELRODRAFT_185462 [Helobdella robusta]|uniref:Voltage-dependent anion-selective channel protein 3 n=1 Tax=Helobdella robusta TaxID=6412 RepID=T1FMU7_HELRO|nr:hypothetical protein HELRODRAFT_185462 [Helobdella robusta]ESO07310.1 hypothetical protein HELRODRAFT_185462 [Helobdella robusta]